MNKEYKLCDVKITSKNWATHLKSIQHRKNDPEQTINPCNIIGRPRVFKLREKCNVEISSTNWARHLNSEEHLNNEPKSTKRGRPMKL